MLKPMEVEVLRRVELDAKVIEKCMRKIPGHAISRSGPLVEYKKMHSLKVAPLWNDVKPFIPFLSALMDETQGRNVHVSSMKAGVKEYHCIHDPKKHL